MTGDQIYKRALRKTHTSEDNYNIADANEDMEIRHQELVDNVVTNTKGDYFWDKGDTDTVVGQSEYVAEKLGIAPDDLDIKKINKVFIKYDSTQTDYTRAFYQSPGTLEKHPDYYKLNQPTNTPFFYIQDNSFFIYPTPSEAITSGIEIFVIHKPKEIDVTSTEVEIEIPTQFHYLISVGMEIDIYEGQGKLNESQTTQVKYDAGIKEMVAFMKQRYNQPIIKSISNLNSYR